jgi:hypothetical protein
MLNKSLIALSALSIFASFSASAAEVAFPSAGFFKGTDAKGDACVVKASAGTEYGNGIEINGPKYKLDGFGFFPGDKEPHQTGCGESPYVKGNTVAYVHKQAEMSLNFLGALVTYTSPDRKTIESVKTKRGGEAFIQGVGCAKYNNKKWDSECNGLKEISKAEYDAAIAIFRPEAKKKKAAPAASSNDNDGDSRMDVMESH